jgi:hypothetical protein
VRKGLTDVGVGVRHRMAKSLVWCRTGVGGRLHSLHRSVVLGHLAGAELDAGRHALSLAARPEHRFWRDARSRWSCAYRRVPAERSGAANCRYGRVRRPSRARSPRSVAVGVSVSMEALAQLRTIPGNQLSANRRRTCQSQA